MSRIREAFEAARGKGDIPDFEGFRLVRSAVGDFGTVDSFQHSEADVVVFSLVRNNSRAGRSGLGFLSDARRMNVLLSRAKSKLVLVGSLRFLREAVRGVDPGGEKDDLRFLTTALDVVQRLAMQRGGDGTALAAVTRRRPRATTSDGLSRAIYLSRASNSCFRPMNSETGTSASVKIKIMIIAVFKES